MGWVWSDHASAPHNLLIMSLDFPPALATAMLQEPAEPDRRAHRGRGMVPAGVVQPSTPDTEARGSDYPRPHDRAVRHRSRRDQSWGIIPSQGDILRYHRR